MKKTNLFYFLFLFLVFNVSYSQVKDQYEKGTVTLKNDEVIKGFLKIESLSKLCKGVCFKQSETDKKCLNYDISQIKSFTTENGKNFELLTFELDGDVVSIFANLLLQGHASLYECVYNSIDLYIVRRNDINYILQKDKFASGDVVVKKYNYNGILNIATEGLSGYDIDAQFSEKYFIKVLQNYNKSKMTESTVYTYKQKKIQFFIMGVSNRKKSDKSEFIVQGIYRIYFPKISKSTSLNTGISYFKYKDETQNYTHTLTTIPIQIQQNLLNKKIRPYITFGYSFGFQSLNDNNGKTLLKEYLIDTFTPGMIYGTGIEIDIFKGLMLKSDLRIEVFNHLLTYGIAYRF